MSEGMMLTLIGLCMAMQAIRVGAAIWQAMTAHRAAEAMEEKLLIEEMRLIEVEMREETQKEVPEQESSRAADEEEKRSLLVRKGEQRIGRRRAEAGF